MIRMTTRMIAKTSPIKVKIFKLKFGLLKELSLERLSPKGTTSKVKLVLLFYCKSHPNETQDSVFRKAFISFPRKHVKSGNFDLAWKVSLQNYGFVRVNCSTFARDGKGIAWRRGVLRRRKRNIFQLSRLFISKVWFKSIVKLITRTCNSFFHRLLQEPLSSTLNSSFCPSRRRVSGVK